jgi:glutamate--cysteine ligase
MSAAKRKPKDILAEQIHSKLKLLEEWQHEQSRNAPPPFYCSIDLRDAGHKIVPVDSNLYPAGFNNICPEDQRSAPGVLKTHLDTIADQLKRSPIHKVLVLPESHTQNAFYIENLYYLTEIIKAAGIDVRVGWYGEATEPLQLRSATDKLIDAYPLEIKGGLAQAGDFVPDAILLNNDFSAGYPKRLDEVKQPILPSHVLGWHSRKKTEHFKYYNELAAEFARIVDIDPWTIMIDTEEVDSVNFNEDQGIDRVAETAGAMLARIGKQYADHGVTEKPFVYVKNNAGTYGIGIMVVRDAEELKTLNRRAKNKMSVGKGKQSIHSVAVQEGIRTTTLVQRLPAEPVIYLFGSHLIGGFLRTNTERNEEENLNSQGMVFKKLCMSDLATLGQDDEPQKLPALELCYGWIARISALATGRELALHRKSS